MIPIYATLTLALIFLAIWHKYFHHFITDFVSVISFKSVHCHYEFKNKELLVFIAASLFFSFWFLRLEVPQIHSKLSRLLWLILMHRQFISWLMGDLIRYFWSWKRENAVLWCQKAEVWVSYLQSWVSWNLSDVIILKNVIWEMYCLWKGFD